MNGRIFDVNDSNLCSNHGHDDLEFAFLHDSMLAQHMDHRLFFVDDNDITDDDITITTEERIDEHPAFDSDESQYKLDISNYDILYVFDSDMAATVIISIIRAQWFNVIDWARTLWDSGGGTGIHVKPW